MENRNLLVDDLKKNHFEKDLLEAFRNVLDAAIDVWREIAQRKLSEAIRIRAPRIAAQVIAIIGILATLYHLLSLGLTLAFESAFPNASPKIHELGASGILLVSFSILLWAAFATRRRRDVTE